jgi:hypothetical protein
VAIPLQRVEFSAGIPLAATGSGEESTVSSRKNARTRRGSPQAGVSAIIDEIGIGFLTARKGHVMARVSKNEKTAKDALKNAREAIKAATKAAQKSNKSARKDAGGLKGALEKGLAASPKRTATVKKADTGAKTKGLKGTKAAEDAAKTKSAKKDKGTSAASTKLGKEAKLGKPAGKDKTLKANAAKPGKNMKSGKDAKPGKEAKVSKTAAKVQGTKPAREAKTAIVSRLTAPSTASSSAPVTAKRGRRKSIEPTLLQLRAQARSAGLSGFSRLNKTDLQNLLGPR